LPPGIALGCGTTSVKGNRGENYENEPLVRQKYVMKKISLLCGTVLNICILDTNKRKVKETVSSDLKSLELE
jgi:hypothetical protein